MYSPITHVYGMTFRVGTPPQELHFALSSVLSSTDVFQAKKCYDPSTNFFTLSQNEKMACGLDDGTKENRATKGEGTSEWLQREEIRHKERKKEREWKNGAREHLSLSLLDRKKQKEKDFSVRQQAAHHKSQLQQQSMFHRRHQNERERGQEGNSPPSPSSLTILPTVTTCEATCFDETQSSTYHPISTSPESWCTISKDAFLLSGETSSLTPINFTRSFNFCLYTFNATPFFGRMFDGVTGFGMGHSSLFPTILDLPDSAESAQIVSFHFASPTSSIAPFLHIGGIEPSFLSQIHWSEAQTLSSNEYLFPTYHLSICDDPNPEEAGDEEGGVKGGLSLYEHLGQSFWITRIDALTGPLHLPLSLYQILIGYLPFECYSNFKTDNHGHLLCLVPIDDQEEEKRKAREGEDSTVYLTQPEIDKMIANISLPHFTFSLLESRSSDPETRLHIPLSNLVTGVQRTTKEGKNFLLVRFGICHIGISRRSLYGDYEYDFIVFGSLPLRPFYVVLDSEILRIGFKQMYLSDTSSSLMLPCAGLPSCSEDEVLFFLFSFFSFFFFFFLFPYFFSFLFPGFFLSSFFPF